MGKNKKENFIFTLICCALMVFTMASYNIILQDGFSFISLKKALVGFLPGFCIALILDWFLVGKIAKSMAAKLSNANTPTLKKVLLISFFMVCGMCFCMTLITSILHQGISPQFPLVFIKNLGRNFIFALPLQLIVVGPIARAVFFKMYPAH
ncbi:MAG: DUF2798 domain-containing protein [Cellulosilyticaceae bacterium]